MKVISLGFDMDKAAAEVEAWKRRRWRKKQRRRRREGAQPTSSNEGAGRMENDIQARTEPPRRTNLRRLSWQSFQGGWSTVATASAQVRLCLAPGCHSKNTAGFSPTHDGTSHG